MKTATTTKRASPKYGLHKVTHSQTRGHVLSGAYQSWRSMKARCLNPTTASYYRYGAVGITVCDRWMSFAGFYADMGDRPPGMTLDRIDNSKGYEPGNCRWATAKAQARNRRTATQEGK